MSQGLAVMQKWRISSFRKVTDFILCKGNGSAVMGEYELRCYEQRGVEKGRGNEEERDW